LILVTGVTVYADLAVAVVAGVIVSALVYAWQASKRIFARTYVNEKGHKVYYLDGPLFFGSVESFQALFNPAADPDDVVVDFMNSRVVDHSALQAIDSLAEKYVAAGKNLHLVHLSPDCRKLLTKAGKMVEVSVIEDPHYGVAADYGDKLEKA